MSEAPTESLDPQPQRLVTFRTLVLAVIAATIVSVCAAVGLSYALIGMPEPGSRGPAGEQGQPGVPGERGRRGPAGEAEVDEEIVWEVIEGDPERVTNLVEDNLSPTPRDVQAEVENVTAELSSLCTDLSFTDALANEFLVCP